eukprot:43101_1
MTFTNFADSLLFQPLQKNNNAGKMHLIFENSTSIQMVQSKTIHIKVSPGEPFIQIGNVFRLLYAHECTIQKSWVLFQKITSQIMGIIYWTCLVWQMYRKTTNIQFLTSASSFRYTKIDIENMVMSHQIKFE